MLRYALAMRRGARLLRLSLLAIANTPVLPTAADGFDRLVTTESLDEVVSLG